MSQDEFGYIGDAHEAKRALFSRLGAFQQFPGAFQVFFSFFPVFWAVFGE